MENLKKVGVLILIVLAVGALAFAQGSDEKKPEVTTISFMYWDQNCDDAYAQIISEFEAQNPDVKVEPVCMPGSDYWTKIQLSLPTETGPDVFWLNVPNAVTYLPTGLIMDLTPYAEKFGLYENFDDSFTAPFIRDGKIYGIPFVFDSVQMFYNKSHFDEMGVPYPTRDWTWDDMLETAKKLTTDEHYGVVIDSTPQHGVNNFVFQNGGHVYSEDGLALDIESPEAKEAIKFVIDLTTKYHVAPEVTEVKETGIMPMFVSGKVSMMSYSNGLIKLFNTELGDDLGCCELPVGKKRASIIHDISYVAKVKTLHKEAVMKFMEFLASPRQAELISSVFMSPYKGKTELFLEEYSNVDTTAITNSMEYGVPLPIPSKNAGGIYSMMKKEMPKVFLADDVDKALVEIDKLITEEINR